MSSKTAQPSISKRLEDVYKRQVLLFEKTSTRTRCAFEVAGFDEGACVTFLTNSQMGKKESIEDTAKVLGRFYDGIESVSYTHLIAGVLQKELDHVERERVLSDYINESEPYAFYMNPLPNPVSYTHLDVYKRQPPGAGIHQPGSH